MLQLVLFAVADILYEVSRTLAKGDLAVAFEEVLGVRPLLVRTGGAIPLVSALAARDVATILTGFALNESDIHSPNERIPAAYLPLGIEVAAALYRHLAELG